MGFGRSEGRLLLAWIKTSRTTSTMLRQIAQSLIQRCTSYVEPAPYGLELYGFWIASAEEVNPGVSAWVREVSLSLLNGAELPVLRSAIQALAITGDEGDIPALRRVEATKGDGLNQELAASISMIQHRAKSLEVLLDEVRDEGTFVAFARALATERERASTIERLDPQRYVIDGALDWKNADIASFIFAGLSALDGNSSGRPPSWSLFAQFLYQGKVVE